MTDGRIIEMKAGDVFYIAPGHDSWVVGDEPYVSLHFMGAAEYAKHDVEASDARVCENFLSRPRISEFRCNSLTSIQK